MSMLLSSRYIMGNVAGAGAYGNVFKAKHKLTKVDVAIKMVSKGMLDSPSGRSHFDSEVKCLKPLNHPLIIRFFDLIEAPQAWFIVTELASKGDLLDFLNNNGSRLSEGAARTIFTELVHAVIYLHEVAHLVHRDLKLENVLIDRNGHIRIIDFGFSKLFSDHSDLFTSSCGSPAYVAPEIITGTRYTTAVDVWSLGVMLYALVVGVLPFDGETVEDQLRRVAFSHPRFPQTLSEPIRSLLLGMLEKDNKKRISLREILAHPWMTAVDEPAPFATAPIDETVVAHLAELGVAFSPQDLVDGIDTEATVAYRILEREQMVHRASRDAPSTPVRSPVAQPSPIVHSSPMTPSRRPQVPSLCTPTHQRRSGNENQADTANTHSPGKRTETPMPSRNPPPRSPVMSPRRIFVK
jgi:serine/threonine protein kinase